MQVKPYTDNSRHSVYLGSRQIAERDNARWVFRKIYADAMMDLVHPGNLGPLPPSPRVLIHKAQELGLLEAKHSWIVYWFIPR